MRFETKTYSYYSLIAIALAFSACGSEETNNAPLNKGPRNLPAATPAKAAPQAATAEPYEDITMPANPNSTIHMTFYDGVKNSNGLFAKWVRQAKTQPDMKLYAEKSFGAFNEAALKKVREGGVDISFEDNVPALDKYIVLNDYLIQSSMSSEIRKMKTQRPIRYAMSANRITWYYNTFGEAKVRKDFPATQGPQGTDPGLVYAAHIFTLPLREATTSRYTPAHWNVEQTATGPVLRQTNPSPNDYPDQDDFYRSSPEVKLQDSPASKEVAAVLNANPFPGQIMMTTHNTGNNEGPGHASMYIKLVPMDVKIDGVAFMQQKPSQTLVAVGQRFGGFYGPFAYGLTEYRLSSELKPCDGSQVVIDNPASFIGTITEVSKCS